MQAVVAELFVSKLGRVFDARLRRVVFCKKFQDAGQRDFRGDFAGFDGFIGAMKVAGGQLKLRVSPETAVTATVGIGPRSEGGYGIDVAALRARYPEVAWSSFAEWAGELHLPAPTTPEPKASR